MKRTHNTNSGFRMASSCLLLGLVLLASVSSLAKAESEESHSLLRGRNLIIGGGTTGDRFPYYVALKDANREIQCGGTLIAPDIVLTAAHCRNSDLIYADVGKYSNIEEDGDEEIEIVDPLLMKSAAATGGTVGMLESSGAATIDKSGFIHPQHDLQKRSYDVMLMKLKKPALGRKLMKINEDPAFPVKQAGGRNEITIIGMGTTSTNGFAPKPDELKQVHVDYLTYEECIKTNSFNLNYKFELLPHMMCTFGSGIYSQRGQCYGDSGGPYIVKGRSAAEDTQVAVVSWAVNCASDVFPMVGSRTSDPHTLKFIKEVTCSMSTMPPQGLCSEENNGASNLSSRLNVPNGVTVSVRIFADPFGHELKWQLVDRSDEKLVYAEIPYGMISGDHLFQDVVVPAGGELKFKIDDAAQDGIFGDSDAILYEIVLQDQNTNNEIIMVEGNGKFGNSKEEDFRVPLVGENTAAYFRAANEDVASDRYASVTGPTAPLKIYIKFADYHEDTAWKVTSVDGTKIFASKNANSYRLGDDVTEEVDLPAGQYRFTISDRRGTDEYRAFKFYQLSYLDRKTQRSGLTGGETIVYTSDGTFEGESISHDFVIPVAAVDDSSSYSSSPADQGIIFGELDLMDEAQEAPAVKVEEKPSEMTQDEEICTGVADGDYCVSNASCCSQFCRGFRCQPDPNVKAPVSTVTGRQRVKTGSYGGYGGSSRGGGYARA